MSRPLAGISLLLIDGNNLLHRESGGVGEGPLRGLLARLQSGVAGVQAVVVLDGHPAPGSPSRQRVSAALELRNAGSRSADDLIVQLASAAAPAQRHGTVVVTDDRALTERIRLIGSRTQRLPWLQGLLARPRTILQTADEDEEPVAGWRPGRGATRKKGNPRRAPRRQRGRAG